MDLFPDLVLSHIGSFLTVKECVACHLATRILKPVCQGVTTHTVKIDDNESAESLGQLLASVFASLPCLKKIKIIMNHVNTVTPAPKSISMPGVFIELSVNAVCSDAAVDSVIEWFEQEPEISIDWICIKGTEKFLRHRIARLNTSISTSNVDALNSKVIGRIPRLVLNMYTHHLDLSNISVDHNIELIIYQNLRSFSCTDPWKITDLVYDTSWYPFDLFESIRRDPMMSKSSRMKQVFVNGEVNIPQSLSRIKSCLHLGRLVPKSVKWLVQPSGPNVIATFQDLKAVGADSICYRICSQQDYLEAMLLTTLYPAFRYDICFGMEFKIQEAKTVQDIFDGMESKERTKWLAVENLLTSDQLNTVLTVPIYT